MLNELMNDFVSPTSEYRGAPFWAWNGKLEPAELRRQIRIMNRMGLGGFFMHSRVGLDTPYLSDKWFECVDACIDEADKLGMKAWLYDEDRWPSGAGGGLVTKNPKYRMRSLVADTLSRAGDLKWTDDTLAAFRATIDGKTARNVKRIAKGKKPPLAKGESILVFRSVENECDSWYNGYTYLDTLSHEAVGEFIKVTHEEYRKRCSRHFGKTVPGIFTDEPNYKREWHGLSWTAKLPQVFRKRYGYDLLARLPELFYDLDGHKISQVRYHYYDCITFLFVDAFSRQIGQWCEANGMEHTGHALAEQTLSSQTNVVGSCMRFYEYMQAPGMDMLTEYRREYDTAKQVSSAARQFGRKWRLTETYGCTGWDFPLAGHKAVGDWQVALGINLRCQHLSYYTMEGEAKRDYPASISYQSPWWEIYPKVEDYFARIHTVMTQGEEVRDLLVIHPVESAWLLNCPADNRASEMSELDSSIITLRDSLLAANIDFDYGDEDILARHGKVARIAKKNSEPTLIVGKARYKAVVVPPLLTMRASTLKLLKRFKAAGGTVIFAGKPAGFVDALASKLVSDFASQCIKAPPKGQALAKATEPTCRRVSITDTAGKQIVPALHLLREDDDAFYLFVCNTGHKSSQIKNDLSDPSIRDRKAGFDDVRISGFAGCKGAPIELDPDSGAMLPAESKRKKDGWEIRTSLPPIGSRLFVISKKAGAKAPEKRKKLKDVKTSKLNPARWDIVLSENNNLVLDRPRYKIGKGQWRNADEILHVDGKVRDVLQLQHRGGRMVQPWACEKSKNPRKTQVELSFSFDVRAIPSGDLFFCVERLGLYRVLVNETPVSTEADCGWWVDKSLRKIPLNPAGLRKGQNEIRLTCNYDENHPGLEAVYLLGNFGTRVRGTNVSVTEMPKTLKLGDWTKQGLAFYSGSVSYLKTIPTMLGRGGRMFVRIPDYRGAAVRIWVNGKSTGIIAWPPNEIDITDFIDGDKTEIAIEVAGHRRNSHGPLHLSIAHPRSIGPYSYITTGKEWSDDYQLVQCGIMEAPQLVIRR